MMRFVVTLIAISPSWVVAAFSGEPDPKEILAAAAKAILEAKTAMYDVRLEGTGDLMGEAPLMSGKVKIARRTSDDPAMILGGKAAARGRIERRAIANEPDINFAMVHDGNLLRVRYGSTLRVIEIDHRRYPDVANSRREMALVIGEFLSPEPFRRQLRSRTIIYGGLFDIEGVSCHRVDVELEVAKSSPLPDVGRFAGCLRQRWFLGVEDHLPRQVEYTQPGGDGPDRDATVVVTLSDLQTNGQFSEGMFALPRPRIWAPPVIQLSTRTPPKVSPPPSPPTERADPPDDSKAANRAKNREQRRAAANREPKPVVGDMAPIWELTDIDGKKHSLTDYRGKVVFIDYWASWCGMCRKARPVLKKLHEQFKKHKDVAFISINCLEKGGDPLASLKRYGYSYPQMLNGSKTSRQYGVKNLPTFVILDKTGKIVHRSSGFHDDLADKLEKVLEKTLAR